MTCSQVISPSRHWFRPQLRCAAPQSAFTEARPQDEHCRRRDFLFADGPNEAVKQGATGSKHVLRLSKLQIGGIQSIVCNRLPDPTYRLLGLPRTHLLGFRLKL